MNSERKLKTMAIVGAVLLLNGVVFTIISMTTLPNPLWGVVIGFFSAGLPLLLFGLVKLKKLNNEAGYS